MVPPAAEPITTAKISFVVDKKEQENDAPFDFVTRMDNNQTLLLRPYEIPVHDLRTHQEQGGETPTIENTGFCVRNWPYHADFQGQGWEEQYCKDAEAFLADLLKAKKVNVFNHSIRRREENRYTEAEAMGDPNKLQPVTAAHIDHNKKRGYEECLKLLDVKEEPGKPAPGMAIFNIWRPLRGPVIDAPLALCDTSSLRPRDPVETMDHYGGGYFMHYSDTQKWYYLKNQMPDEVLVFCCYDSTTDEGCVPHAAFVDVARLNEEGMLPRQSIELRCAVLL